MRYAIALCCSTLTTLLAAQCVADAGRDTVICDVMQVPVPLMLGGDPVVVGGLAPYTYAWSASHSFHVGNSSFHFSASQMLDDTTVANPNLIMPVADLYYTLTVTDANGAQCRDSVLVHISYVGVHLGNVTFYIQQGDSVHLPGTNVLATSLPVSIQWYPADHLDDPTLERPWASPLVTTYYGAVVTDAYGCNMDGGQWITVVVGGMSVGTVADETVRIMPMPVESSATVQVAAEHVGGVFRLLSLEGKEVAYQEVRGTEWILQRGALRSGAYIYELRGSSGAVVRGRLVLK